MKNINLLVRKLLLFLSPFILLVVVAFVADPFKVFREYDDYYKDNFVTSNREFVCLNLFQKNSKTMNYDSFIFGNSRSIAFKVKHWEKYLPLNSKGFHFDASEEGIYGILNKILYIEETGGKLNNVLIILDEKALVLTENKPGYLYISPPALSKESTFDFYIEFIKPFYDPIFVIGYIDYYFFRTHRNYMDLFFRKQKYEDVSDNLTGDLYFGLDKLIAEDSDKYYKKQVDDRTFYDRRFVAPNNYPVTVEEKNILREIKSIFNKHRTNYRIVISPLYDQLPLGGVHIYTLRDIFGSWPLHDYSGNNKFTNSIYNYYEDSHYRINVADDILSEIYSGDMNR